jgi:hypothetical protein
MFWLGLVTGLVIGSSVGVFALALASMSVDRIGDHNEPWGACCWCG